jgi:hypothetical protein
MCPSTKVCVLSHLAERVAQDVEEDARTMVENYILNFGNELLGSADAEVRVATCKLGGVIAFKCAFRKSIGKVDQQHLVPQEVRVGLHPAMIKWVHTLACMSVDSAQDAVRAGARGHKTRKC